MSPMIWSTVFWLSLCALSVAIAWMWGAPKRRFGPALGVLALIPLIASSLSLEAASDARDWVLTTEATELKRSPALSAKAVLELQSGEQLVLLHAQHGGFVSVAAGLQRGWVLAEDTRPVVVR